MIQDVLQTIIEQNKGKAGSLYMRNLLKEELQNIVLTYIYNDKQYKELIFTGGTALRKIYGLPRLSEDLDFDYIGSYDIEEFTKDVEAHIKRGLQYQDVSTKISTKGNTVFIRFPILNDLGFPEDKSKSSVLFVRCDFSGETYGIYATEISSVSTPERTFFVKHYDLPTLFANKIIAFLKRDFFKGQGQESAFKGRDVFDIVWFIERSRRTEYSLKPNWQRLQKAFPGRDGKEIMAMVADKARTIDPAKVYQDLAPFIESAESVKVFSESYAKIIGQNAQYLL